MKRLFIFGLGYSATFIARRGADFDRLHCPVTSAPRRSASCVAASNCQLLNLGKDSLEKMLNDAPKVAAKIIRALAVSLSRRLRMVDGQLLAQQD